MKTLISVLAFTIFFFGCSHNPSIQHEKNYAGHFIVGSWHFDNGGCIETYEFLPDGTRKYTSGQKVAKSKFTISETPSEKSFYKMTNEVFKDNGKTDCSGANNDMTGDSVVSYIFNNPNNDQIVFCPEENSVGCLGPFRKD